MNTLLKASKIKDLSLEYLKSYENLLHESSIERTNKDSNSFADVFLKTLVSKT